jgi:hypothetical protein
MRCVPRHAVSQEERDGSPQILQGRTRDPPHENREKCNRSVVREGQRKKARENAGLGMLSGLLGYSASGI